MKKSFLSFIFLITFICIYTFDYNTNNQKVFKIVSPVEFYTDNNKNYIFDETNTVKVNNINYLTTNSNIDKYPLLKNLSFEEKLYIQNKTNELVRRTLQNKFVTLKNDEIYVDGQRYSDILLNSKLVFTDDVNTQQVLLDNIKKINLEDYFIYNPKSKKYHKLNCEKGKTSQYYRILNKENLPADSSACQHCLKSQSSQITFIPPLQLDKIQTTFSYGSIKIFFQDLNEIYIPNKYCKTSTCKALKNEIDNAKETIDFAIYGINNQDEIINALVNAQKRGVKIRWVCDFDKKHINYYQDTEILKKQIPNFITDENSTPAIMHNKFFIFDNKKVWTGSSNITSTDFTGFNANYSILIESKELAQNFLSEFNQMYNGFFHTSKENIQSNLISLNDDIKIKALFSPKDKIITKSIIPIILNAKEYIYIPIFFLTHKEIANALICAHKKGVDIKIINDATNSQNPHSIHKILRESGIKVKTENYAGKMHMKAMFVDDKISIIGSMNFTKSANNKNDENVIIIYNKEITQYLKQTFLHIWKRIPEKYLYKDVRAESLESIGSCFDGIDNNFDNKIDSQDVGCFGN